MMCREAIYKLQERGFQYNSAHAIGRSNTYAFSSSEFDIRNVDLP